MKRIANTVFAIREDGGFDINPQVEAGASRTPQQKPLKRPRALSIASTCTLKSEPPSPSDSEVQVVESPATRGSSSNPTPKHLNASTYTPICQSECEVQIIKSPMTRNNSASLTRKRPRLINPKPTASHSKPKPGTSRPSDTQGVHLNQSKKPLPSLTAFDIDGFEEVKDENGIINVEDLEEKFEAQFYGAASQEQARAEPTPARNLPICLPQVVIETHTIHGMNLKKGKLVEFLNGGFLKIGKVIKNYQTGEISLRGWRLERCARIGGQLPKKLNELCFVLEVELDDHRPALEQSMVQVGLEGLVKIRYLVSTNYPFPELAFSRDNLPYEDSAENLEYIRDYERLVVRWKYVTFYDNAVEHSRTPIYPTNVRKKLLTGLAEEECTSGYFMDPEILRHNWRGDTKIGGAGRPQPSTTQQTQPVNVQPFECPTCGHTFKRSLELFEHYQNRHEQKSRQSQAQSAACQGQVRRRSIIEILDDDDDDKATRQHRQVDIEDVRVRLKSVLSIDGEEPPNNDIGRISGRYKRKADVDLTSPQISSSIQGFRRVSGSASQRKLNPAASAYTYGDAFCGAGGATRGSVAAGLEVTWGLDFDKNAGKTWKANFSTATHYEMWAHDLVAQINASVDLFVDVLHLSPPCQVFSPVHTRAGKNDQQNFDSLFACDAIVDKARPRIITLEQTFGILHPKFSMAFNALIQTFTSYGYSIAYQIVEFHRYGLAQTRRRLIIVAACPGETLPEIPEYTHSASSSNGLKPFTSVRSVLRKIPNQAPNHNVEAVDGRGKGEWDASGVIPTITCDGGGRGHPDGLRGFTDRELASLQSFPHHHVFHGSCIKKQIGNAVPPLIAEILFKAIIKHLRKADKAEQERHAKITK
ncbi:uncharacterized protein RSE6_00528 [Rhynchosporium secalis]|uniref:DNA (cytosine-5-)-methyltransferase n=1 Tax=Rhynchosporium secalis TaxID=38038 RepID=A0A1E1LVH4_RHYSE|nr:uncharacterized protein RSE6_00528 [Rhynchosporium secalis]